MEGRGALSGVRNMREVHRAKRRLDEATANVDSQSELLIQQATKEITKGRTSIIIAHRLSTIRKADQIIVMEKGQIIERGTHQSLIAAKGHYYQLYTAVERSAEKEVL